MSFQILLGGDCFSVLRSMSEGSVDAVVCDPPYELGFMGKKWDSTGVAFDPATWREVLRVLKPGGYLLAFGGTRTYHRMTVAIEDAGFEIRDCIGWNYATGFPKSRNLPGGWGTALKPAWEPIVVARAPFPGTVAANVLKHGTGAMNIDACRVATTDDVTTHSRGAGYDGPAFGHMNPLPTRKQPGQEAGRWPANLILTHAPGCVRVGSRNDTFGGGEQATSGFVSGYAHNGFVGQTVSVPVYECAPGCPAAALDAQSGALTSGTMTGIQRGWGKHGVYGAGGDTPAISYGDTGGASRFFNQLPVEADDLVPFIYVAKASRSEREAGCDALPARSGAAAVDRAEGSAGLTPRAGAGRSATEVRNPHPTVKPVAVMRHLVRLVTPLGGTVLDPFMGSGTTGIAAVREGFSFIGIEREAEYIALAEARIRHHGGNPEVA